MLSTADAGGSPLQMPLTRSPTGTRWSARREQHARHSGPPYARDRHRTGRADDLQLAQNSEPGTEGV